MIYRVIRTFLYSAAGVFLVASVAIAGPAIGPAIAGIGAGAVAAQAAGTVLALGVLKAFAANAGRTLVMRTKKRRAKMRT